MSFPSVKNGTAMDCSKYIPDKCKADCCGPIPFHKDFFNKNIDKIPKEISFCLDELTFKKLNMVVPVTNNLKCVFLDSKYKCLIYEQRPDVCKLFGQNKHPRMKCPYRI